MQPVLPDALDGRRRIWGVVPAAGASRRMGSSKALLEVDGASFVWHVVRSLSEGGCDAVLVVTAPGDRATADEAEAAGAGVLVNPDPGEGPITSFRVALAALAEGGAAEAGVAGAGVAGAAVAGAAVVGADVSYVAYLPIDHPRVRATTVGALLSAVRAHEPSLALPVHGGIRGHPAIFSRDLFAELEDPALEGGARTVVHRHLARALLVETDDPGVLLDVDTPSEYRDLLRGLGSSEGGRDE